MVQICFYITQNFSNEGDLSTTLYAVSFLYYSAISLIVTVSTGLVGSLITGEEN